MQTILENGDGSGLQQAVADAFPGCHLSVSTEAGLFRLRFHQPGLLRPLEAAELSDGTLRYLLLTASLFSPRLPPLLVLNEPEASLHPELLAPLARLIEAAAQRTQVWVIAHAPQLIQGLAASELCRHVVLQRELGGHGGGGSDHPGAGRLALAVVDWGLTRPTGMSRVGAERICPVRLLPLALLLAAAVAAPPAQADSTEATCILSRHDHTVPVEEGPCTFSQRQGNVNVRFGSWAFSFPSAEQGRTYQRRATGTGLRFHREGQYTLQVLWAPPRRRSPSHRAGPPTTSFWAAGGQSTAGRAVIDVLSVEPNRIRWGNQANGLCDSDYSVENLPWGRNGRYPDQLVPPSQPTDVVVGVARLTLKPSPCSTGDTVIQLAMPWVAPVRWRW